MSSGFQEKHAEKREELARELQQFNGLAASFFRAAAGRIDMAVTDIQVIDILNNTDHMTAGQLADLTGLTTGSITGMLNRLEEAGLVQRERDPNDGRKVIVRLEKGKDETHKIGAIFDAMTQAWNEMASRYSDEQIALLLDFLKRSNALSRNEILRLREAPADKEGTFSAPLGDLQYAQLVLPTGALRLTLHAGDTKGALYQSHFEGLMPDVKVNEGMITIRYPRRLWISDGKQRAAEVKLSTAIPWHITIQKGASEVVAELVGLNLAGLEIKGGLHKVRLDLPMPDDIVPVRLSGGASEVTIRRPAGVAARVYLKGWGTEFVFDDQVYSVVGNNVRLQSPNYETATRGYDIEIASSVNAVTITEG